MNLNDPEMQKQLARWYNPATDIFGTPQEHAAAAERDKALREKKRANGCTCHGFATLCNPCRRMIGIELQPARGWDAYDRQYLKDLGITPLD